MKLTLRQRLRLAIHDPGVFAGNKLGPSWGEGHAAYAEEEESVSDWIMRAVMGVVWPELAPRHIYCLTWRDGDESANSIPDPDDRWPGDRYYTEEQAARHAGRLGYIRHELALEEAEPRPGWVREREEQRLFQKLAFRRFKGGEEWSEQLWDNSSVPTGLWLHRVRLNRSATLDPPTREDRDDTV